MEKDKCTGCRACMVECPMLGTYCTSPQKLLSDLASGKYFNSKDDSQDYIHRLRMPFTCTLCGYCDHVCPENVSMKNVFYDLKKDIIKSYGYPKSFGKIPLAFHQNLSFSKIFSSKLKKPGKLKKSGTHFKGQSRIFIPGCSPSAYSPSIVTSVYEYLNTKHPTLFLKKCCGNPTLSVGDVKSFENYTASLIDEITQLNPSEIVVLCMNCYNTFQKLFPKIPVYTIWEVILREGLPISAQEIDQLSSKLPAFTLHDPCPTRSHDQIHDAVRQVVNQLHIEVHEYKHNKGKTSCCGSGAMLSLVHFDLAEKHRSKRAQAAKTDHILSYCQECVESLSRSDKRAVHLLDLVFGEMAKAHYKGPFEQKRHTTIKKWMHRRMVKKTSDQSPSN